MNQDVQTTTPADKDTGAKPSSWSSDAYEKNHPERPSLTI